METIAGIRRRYYRFGFLAFLAWTLFLAIVTTVSVVQEYRRVDQLVLEVASANVDKDISYRRWASSMGGLYVPVTTAMQPNPWLHIDRREQTTTDGMLLTMVNPAFMTRMVYENFMDEALIKSHITSLKPIRPQNAPDDWERQALLGFNKKTDFKFEQVPIGGQTVYRYMRPMMTEASCLKCHAAQGYQLGDIRGGLSVSIPAVAFTGMVDASARTSLWWAIPIWLSGNVGGFLSLRFLIRRRLEQRRIREILDTERDIYQTVVETSGEGFLKIDAAGSILEANQTYCDMVGHPLEEVVGRKLGDFDIRLSHLEIADYLLRLRQGKVDSFETAHRHRDGHEIYFDVSAECPDPARGVIYAFLHDISERRQQQENLSVALREKDVLLKELYHRTKNNMQVITGLLQLQADQLAGQPMIQQFLQVAVNRIHSMALVHQKLYQSADLSRIDLGDYALNLMQVQLANMNNNDGRISLSPAIAPGVMIPIEKAVPCGLLLNELLTNSLKYAFPGGRCGILRLSIQAVPEQRVRVVCADDGVGMDSAESQSVSGLGLTLVRNLALQLDAILDIRSGPDQGFSCTLEFSLADHGRL